MQSINTLSISSYLCVWMELQHNSNIRFVREFILGTNLSLELRCRPISTYAKNFDS
jgi:hypothetical protein